MIRTAKTDEKRAQELWLVTVLAKRDSARDFTGYRMALDAAKILRHARIVRNVAIAECNRELSNRDQSLRSNANAALIELLAPYKITVTTHGDPRGCVVRLHGAGVPQNGMGEGFGL